MPGGFRGGGAGRCELVSVFAGGRHSGYYPLTDIEPNIGVCKANAASLLTQAGTRLAKDWLLGAAGRGITG